MIADDVDKYTGVLPAATQQKSICNHYTAAILLFLLISIKGGEKPSLEKYTGGRNWQKRGYQEVMLLGQNQLLWKDRRINFVNY